MADWFEFVIIPNANDFNKKPFAKKWINVFLFNPFLFYNTGIP